MTFLKRGKGPKEETCISLQGQPNKVSQTEELVQQKFIISQFWRLKVQDQSSAGLVSPWLADPVHILTMSSHGLFSVCTHPGVPPSSCKGTSHIGLRPYPYGLI